MSAPGLEPGTYGLKVVTKPIGRVRGIEGFMDDPLRGTGRTTALMLRAIAEAIEKPHTPVEFRDHVRTCHRNKEVLAKCLSRMIETLQLKINVFCVPGSPITLVSKPDCYGDEKARPKE